MGNAYAISENLLSYEAEYANIYFSDYLRTLDTCFVDIKHLSTVTDTLNM